MQNELLDRLTNISKNSIKPMANLNMITSRTFEKITKQNLDTLNEIIACNVAHMQSLANTKKIEDVFAVQSQMIKDSGSKAVNHMQKSLEALVDASSEFSKWFEEGIAVAFSSSSNLSNVSSMSDKKGSNVGGGKA